MTMDKTRLRIIVFLFSIAAASFIANYLIVSGCSLRYLGIDMSAVNSTLSDENLSVFMVTVFQRIKQLVIIILLFKFIKTDLVLAVLIGLSGVIIGLLVSVETYYQGITGVIYTILCFFPHFVFYCINIKLLSEYYGDSHKRSFFSGNGAKLKFVIINLLVFLLGVGSELIINRFFLKNFYQYIVLD